MDIQGKILKKKSGFRRYLLLSGSLAVETALALPIFLFSLLSMLSLLILLKYSIHLEGVLTEEGLWLSQIAYDKSLPGVWELTEDIIKRLDVGDESVPVQEGLDGLNMTESDLADKEIIKIYAGYQGKLPFDPFNLFHKEFCQGVIIHSWIGYEHGLNGKGHIGEEVYVYVTEDSEVYHLSRNCTHIMLKVEATSSESVKSQRNIYGDKYQSCSHCHAKLSDGRLYITPEGNCYHNTLSCSGLTRTVRAIPLSQVGNLRPCSRCGH